MEPIWICFWAVILIIVSIVLMRIIQPWLIKELRAKGKIGIDVHKLDKPEVAEMGGISILIVACTVAVLPIIFTDLVIVRIQIIVFMGVVGIAGIIGLIDDLYGLGSKMKPLLVAGASIPLLIANFVYLNQIFNPWPDFPLVGQGFNIDYLYWILVPIGIAMAANAVNMIDVVNGSMSGPCVIIFGVLLICSLLKQPVSEVGVLLSAIMFGVMLIFYKYNRFPAKVFSGDVGSLAIGAALGAIAIMGGLEVVTIVVAMPLIINAFQILASVRGFVEGKKHKSRPSIVKSDGTIAASTDNKAPLTLMRIIMAKKPLKEPEIARNFTSLTIFCGVLAIITLILTDYIKFTL
jgi:UDP-N-acetylglucosamine--dolichyl-phosphate N-acetylglucosaminephosphotransferase